MTPDRWRSVTVQDIAAPVRNALVGGPFESNLVSRDYVPAGVPVIRGQNMSLRRWIDGEFAYVSPAKADELMANNARPGDLVFTQRGTLGQVALVPTGGPDRYLISQSQMKLTPDPQFADPLFLYYSFSSPAQRDYIIRNAIRTGVPHTNLDHLRRTPLLLPPLPEQRAIASILGALDDKIDLNRCTNETLEALALTLFRAWHQSLDTSKSKVEDLIRKGTLDIGDGYRAKNDELSEPGLPFIRAAYLNNGFDTDGAATLHESSVAKAGAKVSRVGDVAFTSKGTVGRFARVGEHTNTFVYSPQVCYWRSLNPTRLHPAVLYCWMQTDDLKRQILAVAGQTDMAPYVSLRDQKQMLIPQFPPSHLELAEKLEPLLTRHSLNIAESRTLAALRDTLLPKLISGELRIKDAERLAEAAL